MNKSAAKPDLLNQKINQTSVRIFTQCPSGFINSLIHTLSMRGKEDLFQLVKAMSRSEKRYFTIDAQKAGKKSARYLQLFKALSDMDTYDEDALKKGSKNFSADKGYLYDAILRTMRDYRSPKSKAAQIKEKILDSKYLFERGLYEQCNSRLEEARLLASELGDELLVLEVIRERLHTIKSNKEKNLAQTIDDLLRRRRSCFK